MFKAFRVWGFKVFCLGLQAFRVQGFRCLKGQGSLGFRVLSIWDWGFGVSWITVVRCFVWGLRSRFFRVWVVAFFDLFWVFRVFSFFGLLGLWGFVLGFMVWGSQVFVSGCGLLGFLRILGF